MKILIPYVWLLLCSISQAQPVSLGGITPGKTTREELKSLVTSHDLARVEMHKNDVDTDSSYLVVQLNELEGASIGVSFQGDVIYQVEWHFINVLGNSDVKNGLVKKYGVPGIRSGEIRKVTCRNGFGASFARLAGDEELRWPIKNGVQGFIKRSAGQCGKNVTEDYVMQHVVTVKAMKAAELALEKKESEAKSKKLGSAL